MPDVPDVPGAWPTPADGTATLRPGLGSIERDVLRSELRAMLNTAELRIAVGAHRMCNIANNIRTAKIAMLSYAANLLPDEYRTFVTLVDENTRLDADEYYIAFGTKDDIDWMVSRSARWLDIRTTQGQWSFHWHAKAPKIFPAYFPSEIIQTSPAGLDNLAPSLFAWVSKLKSLMTQARITIDFTVGELNAVDVDISMWLFDPQEKTYIFAKNENVLHSQNDMPEDTWICNPEYGNSKFVRKSTTGLEYGQEYIANY